MPVVYGQLAILESATNPIRGKAIPSDVEMRDIHYDGEVFGQTAVPMHGAFRMLKVDGKSVPVRSGDIDAGCIDLRGLGKTNVLFSSSFSPTVTLAMTPEQAKRFQ